MKYLAAFFGTLLIVGLFAGAYQLDDPEALTAQVVNDANKQDDACEKNPFTCRRDAQEAAKDPRVQATLRRLCKDGEVWACTLVRPKNQPML